MCGSEVGVVAAWHGLRVDFRVGVAVRVGAGEVEIVEGRVGIGWMLVMLTFGTEPVGRI